MDVWALGNLLVLFLRDNGVDTEFNALLLANMFIVGACSIVVGSTDCSAMTLKEPAVAAECVALRSPLVVQTPRDTATIIAVREWARHWTETVLNTNLTAIVTFLISKVGIAHGGGLCIGKIILEIESKVQMAVRVVFIIFTHDVATLVALAMRLTDKAGRQQEKGRNERAETELLRHHHHHHHHHHHQDLRGNKDLCVRVGNRDL